MSNLKPVGIIAEYNPFHLGHTYHIEKAREITDSNLVIVVMSGNFIQRGEPALADKYTRAQMALKNGADLVIELPVIASCSSASYFAKGSMAILKELNVPAVCFGSESGNISELDILTDILINHSELLDSYIKEYVSTGISYPLARNKAIDKVINSSANTTTSYNAADYKNTLNLPNNILGIEYMLEIKKNKYNITPYTIRRQGNNYNDIDISETFSSASAIRNSIINLGTLPENTVPANVYSDLTEYGKLHHFASIDDFSDIIRYRLLELKQDILVGRKNDIADLPEYLLNKLLKFFNNCHTASELIATVKTKDLTYTRISRALMHLILNITVSDYETFKNNPCKYIRILGFNEKGTSYLSLVKKNLNCPLISKPANFKEYLTKDIFASDLYNMVVNKYSKEPLIDDYRHKIIQI